MARAPGALTVPGLGRIEAIDAALAAEVRDAFERLGLAATALSWAQARLPSLLGAAGPNGLLKVVVDEAVALTGAPEAWALSVGEGDPPSFVALASGSSAEGIPAPREISRSILGRVLREHEPVWSDDAGNDARFAASRSVHRLELRSVGCVPIGAHAALYLLDPALPGRFAIQDRLRVGALCKVAGAVLDARATPPPMSSPVAGFIGEAPVMREVYDAIRAFAPMPWPALILGETGVGKELAARALHALSPRAQAPFVAVNCGAIPEELAESFLFGHERGSFTGAEQRREGVCERVGDGTLFLDEVAELSPRAQVKLLRLIEDGTFERVGGRAPMAFRGRIVAATLRPLDATEGGERFRVDLLHRLAGCVVRLPPLRERLQDLPAIADHLVRLSLAELDMPDRLALSADAHAALRRRAWPGNVRELRNALRGAIARALAAGDPAILPAHLGPPATGQPPAGEAVADLSAITDLQQATDDFQRRVVRAALDAAGGSRTEAAARLGVSRQWLHRLIARWGDDGG